MEGGGRVWEGKGGEGRVWEGQGEDRSGEERTGGVLSSLVPVSSLLHCASHRPTATQHNIVPSSSHKATQLCFDHAP